MYFQHTKSQSHEVAAVIPSNRAEYGVSERLRNLLKVTQLVSARAGIQIHFSLVPELK